MTLRAKVALGLVFVMCAACSTGCEKDRVKEAPVTSESVEAAREFPAEYLEARGRSDELSVTLTRAEISVLGVPAVTLDGGRVRTSDKKGGEKSLLITPLFEALKVACPEGERSGSPTVSLFADADVTYSLIIQAMYTAGQAGWGCGGLNVIALGGTPIRFRLMVARPDGWDGFDLTTPKISVGPVDEQGLVIAPEPMIMSLGLDGDVRLAIKSASVPAIEGCPADGATVCAVDGRMDSRRLYNELVALTARVSGGLQLVFTADGDVEMSRVADALNVARTRRAGGQEDGTFSDDAAFSAAAFSREPTPRGDTLVPEIMLSVVQ